MVYSVFEIFKIGIGPSSSHTLGPMKIASSFVAMLKQSRDLALVKRLKIELYGSLGATGVGHESHKALVFGLLGFHPESIDIDAAHLAYKEVCASKSITLVDTKTISFDPQKDILYKPQTVFDFHSNALCIEAFDKEDKSVLKKLFYSIGGGSILCSDDMQEEQSSGLKVAPFPFSSARELMEMCKKEGLSISELVMQNELAFHEKEEVVQHLLNIWDVMQACVKRGCTATGKLPHSHIPRRAGVISKNLLEKSGEKDLLDVMDRVNLWALAVNEENACGGQVVTAPTNGAAGILPAVMLYMRDMLLQKKFHTDYIVDFLLTAGAIAILYKKNASISGADVGCQGEVGVACSMAAGALAGAMGGSIEQIENAAEIGMEHNLGLTCDPVGGMVQVPCIERNAMAAIKAVNAARMALRGDGKHFVSLDSVIRTMFETGRDMKSKYKETSTGGLAVNIVEC